jgi:hypothetical protein
MSVMACHTCEQSPCACVKKLAPGTPTTWLIQSCTTPGCLVTIRRRVGQHEAVPVCKWCLANTAYNVRVTKTAAR